MKEDFAGFNNLIDVCLQVEDDPAVTGKVKDQFIWIIREYFFQEEKSAGKNIELVINNLPPPQFLSPGEARIRLETRELVVFAGSGVQAGSAMLAARPEDLRLSTPGTDATNALPATILRKRYLGFKISYRVRLASGRVIAIDLNGGAKESFGEGQSVLVLFNQRASIVVPR